PPITQIDPSKDTLKPLQINTSLGVSKKASERPYSQSRPRRQRPHEPKTNYKRRVIPIYISFPCDEYPNAIANHDFSGTERTEIQKRREEA
ncbi:hypothetical protein, partial [Bifidobacterium pseudocatenulatum]|uniref:hypothetical protein n=2 Tax=Bifidobacterium pseudocatenulatum TaxID=28026 RepID=UPI0022E536A7